MRMLWALALLTAILQACGGDKKSGTGTATTSSGATENDFTGQFGNLPLKYFISDTSLDRQQADEKPLEVTGGKWFPDSLMKAFFGPGAKIKYYPIGKVQNEDNEMYVVMKAVSGDRKGAWLLCYDGSGYRDGLLICRSDNDPRTYYSASIDKSFNIKVIEETRTSPDDVLLSDKTLAYNSGRFMVVVNNDPGQELAVINPIDTLPQTRKYSGDYHFDAKNFLSVRDGRDTSEYMFFYHFRKGSDDCEGEIKGRATVTGGNTARYLQDGDPCVILFTFTNTQVTIKEDQGCGSYRGMDCKLDGTYPKKKKAVVQPPSRNAKDTVKRADKKKPQAPPKPPVKKAPVVNTEVQ